MIKKLTYIEFIEKAKKVHGDKYDYSKVEYVDTKTKVCIICPEHGEFWQTPGNHMSGKGCPSCGTLRRKSKRKKDKETFIVESIANHNITYDYSKVEYINSQTKVCIICPEHGEFWQTPNSHLRGAECPKCSHRSYKYEVEEFIEKAKKVHGNKYDYSKVKYVDNHTKVCIICHEHGEFWQEPSAHLRGQGCPKCAYILNGKNRLLGSDNFIKMAKMVHANKYDYSKVEYINSRTKVCIICPEHGEFWQTPSKHLFGQGCPYCNKYKLEEMVKCALDDSKVEYIYQYKAEWLRNDNGNFLSLDFYLPEYNIAIECQGIQHFKPVKHFGGCERFNKQIINDKLKKIICKNNNIDLLYVTDKKIKTNIDLYNNDNTSSIEKLKLEILKKCKH